MQLNRVIVEWAGPQVRGAACNVLHFAGDVGAPNPAAIKTAYQGLLTKIPGPVTLTIPSTGDVIEDTTGRLVDTWSATGGGTIVGTGNSECAAGVGASLTWDTGGIVNGRRLRGRTFIAPLAWNCYDNTGTLASDVVALLNTFGNALMTSGPLAVWHRPTSRGASDGNSYGVQAFRLRDKVAYLSSRRD